VGVGSNVGVGIGNNVGVGVGTDVGVGVELEFGVGVGLSAVIGVAELVDAEGVPEDGVPASALVCLRSSPERGASDVNGSAL
jgi:hypothetical protein